MTDTAAIERIKNMMKNATMPDKRALEIALVSIEYTAQAMKLTGQYLEQKCINYDDDLEEIKSY